MLPFSSQPATWSLSTSNDHQWDLEQTHPAEPQQNSRNEQASANFARKSLEEFPNSFIRPHRPMPSVIKVEDI